MSTPTLEARDAHYDTVLADMVDDGAMIVRDLATEDASAIDKAEPYERLTRAVRRTIILARHIAQNPLRIRQSPTEAKSTPTRPSVPPSAAARDPDTESLRPERPERLQDDLADDLGITQRPLDDAIAEIRRDLALAEAPPKPARFARPYPHPLEHDLDDPDDDEVLLRDTVRRPSKTPDG